MRRAAGFIVVAAPLGLGFLYSSETWPVFGPVALAVWFLVSVSLVVVTALDWFRRGSPTGSGQVRGRQGVAEAGACGFLVALMYLAQGIVTRPMEAPPYVIVYGGAALILGLLVGLFLRMTAVLVLKFHPSAAG